MSNEIAIFEELRDIIAHRVNYYEKESHLVQPSKEDNDRIRTTYQTYQSCLDMLEYALDGNWSCLEEFNYIQE